MQANQFVKAANCIKARESARTRGHHGPEQQERWQPLTQEWVEAERSTFTRFGLPLPAAPFPQAVKAIGSRATYFFASCRCRRELLLCGWEPFT